MRSSSVAAVLSVAGMLAGAECAAQPSAQGFAVDRFSPAPAGSGWFAMDALALDGGLSGSVAVTAGYARRPLHVGDGGNGALAVVSDAAFANIGIALQFRRWRFHLDLGAPLVVYGTSGTAGGWSFAAPSVDLGTNPDRLSDARFGIDVRISGRVDGPFRIGAGVQLFVPFGAREEYDTDGSVRAAGRVLVAGDLGRFRYAAHAGVHLRFVDDAAPGSPRGTELLAGGAAGVRVGPAASALRGIIGAELFAATPFAAFLDPGATSAEVLLSAALEHVSAEGITLRVRLGAGTGICACASAPDARVLLGVEMVSAVRR